MSKVKVLIVDDEALARRHIRSILAADEDVIVVGECGDGREAVNDIRTLQPDILLLDVQMPELNGFEVLTEVGTADIPVTIFVTAYNEYAMRAFDVNAIDYVLKPIERERLLVAVKRAKSRLPARRDQLAAIEDAIRLMRESVDSHRAERIAMKIDGRHVFLATDTIDWIEAVDDYVRVHVGRSSHLVRATLGSFAEQLPSRFLRIHRSAIVNTERVREVMPTPQGEYKVLLSDGTRLPTGRSYRTAIAELVRAFAVNSK